MILLDSSVIIAYSNLADVNHEKAFQVVRDIVKGKYGTSAITDYIFDEVVTVMLVKTKNLRRIEEMGEKLLGANLMLRVDEEVFNLAWKMFEEQQKPRFSFTDCTSIATCRMNGISNIASFDEDLALKGLNIIGL